MKKKTDWEQKIVRLMNNVPTSYKLREHKIIALVRNLLLRQQQKMKGQTRRIWYQKGYEDGRQSIRRIGKKEVAYQV